jgi:hypothetical protein
MQSEEIRADVDFVELPVAYRSHKAEVPEVTTGYLTMGPLDKTIKGLSHQTVEN